MAKDGLGGGMDAEGRGNKVEPRWVGAKSLLRKVAVLLKIAEASSRVNVGEVMMADADPVIEPLQRKVQILFSLELDQSKLAAVGNGKQIKHAPILMRAASCERGNLRVDRRLGELGIDGRKAVTENTFKPTLRLKTKERVAVVGLCARSDGPPAEEAVNQIPKERCRLSCEERFIRACANGDLHLPVEGLTGITMTNPRELQAMEEKGEIHRASEAELTGRSR
jgi:hypothetical protein